MEAINPLVTEVNIECNSSGEVGGGWVRVKGSVSACVGL